MIIGPLELTILLCTRGTVDVLNIATLKNLKLNETCKTAESVFRIPQNGWSPRRKLFKEIEIQLESIRNKSPRENMSRDPNNYCGTKLRYHKLENASWMITELARSLIEVNIEDTNKTVQKKIEAARN